MATDKPLTDKQERFCQEYMVDMNGTQAALRAGYSENSACEIASENLRKPQIQARLTELRSKLMSKLEITQERVMQEYARIGFSDLRKMLSPNGHLINPQDWDDDTAAAIASLEIVAKPTQDGESAPEYVHKIKLWDKKGALDSMSRALGIFEKEEASQDVHVHIHQVAKDF
tara:strand:- start:5951 stop:6466 length:516 start_codon:yes stop_codon:yes gene_type:complete